MYKRQGVGATANATLTAFKRSYIVPTDNPGTLTYTFITAGWTPGNGWSKELPDGLAPAYAVSATAYGTETTDQVLDTDWSDPALIFRLGASSHGVLVNGGFETGDEEGWDQADSPTVVDDATAFGGSFYARIASGVGGPNIISWMYACLLYTSPSPRDRS